MIGRKKHFKNEKCSLMKIKETQLNFKIIPEPIFDRCN